MLTRSTAKACHPRHAPAVGHCSVSSVVICLLFATLCLNARAQQSRPTDDARLTRLIEQIANGDEVEAEDAVRRLIDESLAPLVSAIGSLEERPASEQLRLRAALNRVHAVLRLRLFRAELESADRDLLDAFATRYPELVEMLFDDDPDRRSAAIRQLPMEPGTAVGLLVAKKVDDPSAEVAEVALAAAKQLRDPVVSRRLTRYVSDVTTALRDGLLPAGNDDLQVVLTDLTKKSILVLGEAGAKDAVPVVLEALALHGRGPQRRYFEPGLIARVLGQLGDERAAPALLELLDDQELISASGLAAQGRGAKMSVGDAALLALTRIYAVPPSAFGLQVVENQPHFAGFGDDGARRAGYVAFRRWHQENAAKPASQRTPPVVASQPAASQP